MENFGRKIMELQQYIERLIKADNLSDYLYFVEFEFISGRFLPELQKVFQDPSKEKYLKAAKSFFEMQITRGILNRNNQLENGLDLVNRARKKGKPHVSVALLEPERRYNIGIQMPYNEVETLAGEFINHVSCPDFIAGLCINDCPYNMAWTEQVNCYDFHRAAYKLLRKYAGGNNKKVLHSIIKIREKRQ